MQNSKGHKNRFVDLSFIWSRKKYLIKKCVHMVCFSNHAKSSCYCSPTFPGRLADKLNMAQCTYSNIAHTKNHTYKNPQSTCHFGVILGFLVLESTFCPFVK